MKLLILALFCLVALCQAMHKGVPHDDCDICDDDFDGFGTPASKCGCCPWPCCCKCVNITGEQGPCQYKIDLLFIMDSSGSIGPDDWEVGKQFVSDVVEIFQLVGSDQLVAMIKYSTNATLEWDFNGDQTSSKENLNEAIQGMEILGKFTNTVEAMEMGVEQVLVPEGGDRPDVPNVCVLITDGRANMRLKEQESMSARLQEKCEVIAIGVTNNIQDEELAIYAGPDGRIYHVNDYRKLRTILTDLQSEICPEVPSEEKCYCCCTPEQFFGGGGAYYYMK